VSPVLSRIRASRSDFSKLRTSLIVRYLLRLVLAVIVLFLVRRDVPMLLSTLGAYLVIPNALLYFKLRGREGGASA